MEANQTQPTNQYSRKSLRRKNGRAFLTGMRDGIPIALGYFAVSFSLGIIAKKAGLTPFQGFLASLFTNASAGEYAVFYLIAANATYMEIALITLIANARYMLMSCALSQKLKSDTPTYLRMMLGCTVTDELFGISVARPGALNPFYTYGAFALASPCWAVGTALGIVAGNLLPLRAVSAFGVALYGMFIAIIVPPCRKNHVLAVLIPLCFAASYGASVLPLLSSISSGTRTIILTVAVSAAAAVFFPVNHDEEAES